MKSKANSRRVLLVEDVPEMGEWLKVLLEADGVLSVCVSTSASEARELVLRRRPDFILLDEVLPGESAYDVLEEWSREGIAVVLLTGMERPSHAVPREARARVIKPVGVNEAGGDRDGARFVREVLAVLQE